MRRYFAVPHPVPLPLSALRSRVEPRRAFFSVIDEKLNEETPTVPIVAVNADRLEKNKVLLEKKAFGIPFHVSDAEAVDRVCAHHGASVALHGVERYMMPFWLTKTSAGGSFKADILQPDPTHITQQSCYVWVTGPTYKFAYPFDEYLPVNQVSASYLEPMSTVESCLTGTHIPSMLISRFELLEELEKMQRRPKVIPFAMSTVTALSIVEKRVNRRLVLDRIDKELKKFHGSFIKSNVSLTHVFLEANGVRPIFLPLIKLVISTANNPTPIPAYICGATGKVVGPVIHLNKQKRAAVATAAALGTLFALAPFVEPGIATAAAIGCGVSSGYVLRKFRSMQCLQEQARQMLELKSLGILNFATDSAGYRWTPEDEERHEYEYREELRRQARQKDAFEQRVKEEAARDRARQQGKHFDAKRRRRTDLIDADPLGYYEILGLAGKEFSCTAKEISKAFREAVRVHHPDVNRDGDAEAKKKHMQRIIVAYKVLHNPKTKKQYDAGELTEKTVTEEE